VSRFNYTYVVPGLFAQDEYSLAHGDRIGQPADSMAHSKYGAFSVRAFFRSPAFPHRFTARLSTRNRGICSDRPFTEETETVGLTTVAPLKDLKPERAWRRIEHLG